MKLPAWPLLAPTPEQLFEPARWFTYGMLRCFRLANTAVDHLFYNTEQFRLELAAKGGLARTLGHGNMAGRFVIYDLSALTHPEGTVMVVDPATGLIEFLDHGESDEMPDFKGFLEEHGVDTVTITGVGSSAMGSAAFAWDVATALGRPVAAIVAGYGIADVISEGMGGFYVFGLRKALRRLTQQILEATVPPVASPGNRLARKAARSVAAADRRADALAPDAGEDAYETGSPDTDILHALLVAGGIRMVVGHSKGALSIEHALAGSGRTDVKVITLGCVVDPTAIPGARQYVGSFDALGLLNSWGNRPTAFLPTHHSTNAWIPAAIPVRAVIC